MSRPAKPKKQPLSPPDEAGGGSLSTGPFLVKFEPRSPAQQLFLELYPKVDVLFGLGPAGCGKSMSAIGAAMLDIKESPGRKSLLVLRPAVEAGRTLGYLPGDISEKIMPYMGSFTQALKKVAFNLPSGLVRFECLNFQRGMAQPHDAPVLTPAGYRPMGSLVSGDLVVAADGSLTPILAVYPQGSKPVYRFTFSDGTTSDSCPDHLWVTRTISERRRGLGFTSKTTAEILDSLLTPHGQNNHSFPLLSSPIAFPERHLDIDPYLMGLLLGDGSLNDHSPLSFCTADSQLVTEIAVRLPPPVSIRHHGGYDYGLAYRRGKNNPLETSLRAYGLISRQSHDKFIPFDFKFNTPAVRLELLRGLLDTDGWVCEHRSGASRVQYCSVSPQLAEDVLFLVQSLGGIARCRTRLPARPTICRGRPLIPRLPSYQLDILLPAGLNPFRLERKSSRFTQTRQPYRVLRSASLVGYKECSCIRVAHPQHLYLTSGCVITHNTYEDAIVICDEAQNASYAQLVMLLTRLGRNSKILVLGDPDQCDIRPSVAGYDVDLDAAVDALTGLARVGLVSYPASDSLRHPLVAKMLRRLNTQRG